MEVKISSVSYLVEKHGSVWGKHWNRIRKVEAEKILLLRDITITLKPGSVTAFFGTGEGFKRLVECIALRQTEGFMSGSIQYDNSVRTSGAFRDIVYVSETGGSHFDSLTVFDYLFYAARLRIAQGNIECRERARVATKLVGLDGGSKIGTLNKADLRLLTIAGELVGYPTLVCIMDPLEGLDAAGAIDVMHALHKVAKRTSTPTTVVYAVTGLNNDMIRYVDTAVLFARTRVLRTITFKEVDISVQTGVQNLMTDISVQISQVADGTDESTVDGIVNKLSLDIEDLICSVPVRLASPAEAENRRSMPVEKHGSYRHMDATDSYGLGTYDDDDDNYLLSSSRPSQLSRERAPPDPDGWSSLPEGQPRWQKPGSPTTNLIPPSQSRGNFLSSNRRRYDLGIPSRVYKPLAKELLILISRQWKYHVKNVR